MSYELECTNNDGFEDQLTASTKYKVEEFKGGSVLIKNDNGQERWYGESKFCQPEYQD